MKLAQGNHQGHNGALHDHDFRSVSHTPSRALAYDTKIKIHTAAHAASPATAEALLHELQASQPGLLQRITKTIPPMLPKAYRFVGEMEEIADFVRDGLGEGESNVHRGLAQVYGRVERSMNEPGLGDVEILKKFVEKAVEDRKG